jgi:hypothetical protein
LLQAIHFVVEVQAASHHHVIIIWNVGNHLFIVVTRGRTLCLMGRAFRVRVECASHVSHWGLREVQYSMRVLLLLLLLWA